MELSRRRRPQTSTSPCTPTPLSSVRECNGLLSPLTPGAGPEYPPTPPIVSHIDRIVANLSDGGFCGSHAAPNADATAAAAAASSSSASTNTSSGRKRSRANTASSNVGSDAPNGLESQYSELHRLLTRGLIGSNDDAKRNVSALLMGPRGCGKSLVVERVLSDLRTRGLGKAADDSHIGKRGEDKKDVDDDTDEDETEAIEGRFFRIIRLNGLLLRGDDVGAAIREMVRQLSDVAIAEAKFRQRQRRKKAAKRKGRNDVTGGESMTAGDRNDREDEDDHAGSIASDLLRLRRQGFNSNLAMLDETLRAARVDSMPVLVVLEELDAFLPTGSAGPAVGLPGDAASSGFGSSAAGRRIGSRGPRGESLTSGPSSSDRQLLLYHLLDRVADHRTLLSLVGMTSQLSTVGAFEKRVRSRAEGTSKIIYFGRPASFDVLVKMLSSKFDVPVLGVDKESDEATKFCRRLGDQLVNILFPSRSARRSAIDVDDETDDAKVRAMLRRNYQMGKDVRWFCRVITVALSLLAHDCASSVVATETNTPSNGNTSSSADDKIQKSPTLSSRYIIEALMTMGGMLRTEEDTASITMNRSGGSSLHSLSGGTETPPISTTYGPFDKNGKPMCKPGLDDPRIQELLDLPESQLAVLLSARRILCRDAAEDSSLPKPLTFGRIRREFETYYKGNAASGLTTNLYEGNLLYYAFIHLMETGLVCPAVDHTGGGPLQYYMHHTRTHAAMEPMALEKMPLHVLVDINSELGVLLKEKMLDCSTALRDWAMRSN